MAEEIPEDITRTTGADGVKGLGPEVAGKAPTQSFEQYMNKAGGNAPSKTGAAGTSPMDLAQGAKSVGAPPTLESVQSQMQSTSGVLADLQNQLQKKNLKLNKSQKYLLRNKLSDANNYIRQAATKAGVDVGKPPTTTAKQGPIAKFLGLLGDSQNQINKANDLVQSMSHEGRQVLPGQLLTIQVKLAKAQQELEYSSILVSQSVSGIKTLFQIQI